MSKNGGEASDADPAPTSENTVLDFLYYDAQRIGSYLAQFDPAGHLQGFKEHEQHGSQSGFKSTLSAEGSIPTLAKAAGVYESSGQKSETGQAERQYDPFWVNAISFLAYLEDRQLCYHEVDDCPLGHFFRISGKLSVIDIGFVKRVMTRRSVQTAMLAGGYQQAQLAAAMAGQKFNEQMWKAEADLGLEMIDELPSSIIATFTGKHESWASLKSECMVIGTSDILLQHGHDLPGEWEALGILTAIANEGDAPRYRSHAEGAALGEKLGIRALVHVIAPIARAQAGRPHGSYGFTPLLIFRTVHGRGT